MLLLFLMACMQSKKILCMHEGFSACSMIIAETVKKPEAFYQEIFSVILDKNYIFLFACMCNIIIIFLNVYGRELTILCSFLFAYICYIHQWGHPLKYLLHPFILVLLKKCVSLMRICMHTCMCLTVHA